MLIACSVCVFDIASTVVPALGWWCIGIPVWLLVLSVISARGGGLFPSIPSVGYTITLIIVAWFLAFLFIGPLPIFALGIVILIWLARTGYRWIRNVPPEGTKLALAASVVALLVLGGASVADSLHYRSLSPAGRVLEQHGPGVVIELNRLGAPSIDLLPVYREVLVKGDSLHAYHLAKHIAQLEDPEVAVPLALEILATAEKHADGEFRYILHNRLRELTGIACPADTTAEEWRRRLAEY